MDNFTDSVIHGVVDTASQVQNFSPVCFFIGVLCGVLLLAFVLVIDYKISKK